MPPLNIPFVSEAYDRLMAEQAQCLAMKLFDDADHFSAEAVRLSLESAISDIRRAMAALGMNQSQLAEALGIDAPRMSKLASGATPIDKRTDLAIRALLAIKALKEI